MVIAIPKYGNLIAPCFETAINFLITVAEDKKIILSRQVSCTECRGFGRVNLLKENNVNVLICGGIETFYRNLLLAANIEVISPVATETDNAIDMYLAGYLSAEKNSYVETDQRLIPLDDLICWSKDIFSINGYRIFSGSENIPFPVDFLAEIDCPVCRKAIMIAVCCGAHAYRADYELKEFERVSRFPKFHGRVYIHPDTEFIRNQCAELGIDLIDPFSESPEGIPSGKKVIPLLKIPVIGHEKAFLRDNNRPI